MPGSPRLRVSADQVNIGGTPTDGHDFALLRRVVTASFLLLDAARRPYPGDGLSNGGMTCIGTTSPCCEEYLAAIDVLSAGAYRAYRDLVYGTEGFETFFHEATVIGEISRLNIGSRPASRKPSTRIADLRAIPWVFSWAQSRVMLPGWYGFGSAVAAWVEAHPTDGMETLRAMYREWPFFRTTLSNIDMVMAKSDIAIASRYVEMVEEATLREAIFARVRAEWHASIEALLAIMEQRALLESNPLLARSIRNRFPYLDPLNHMQIELLKRYRAGDTSDDVVTGIQLTINGLAAGLRNSG
jgi:phosphoenolpyruvate carboxylase